MSPQADYVVSNGTGAAVRSDINGQLAAIVSNNSGASAPATTYAYMLWADTSTNLLKLRNGANSAWITVGDLTAANLGLATLASPTFTGTATIPTLTVSTAANIPLGSAASPTLYFTGDSNTGLYSPGADQVALSTGGTGRLFIDSSGRCGIGTSSPGAPLNVVQSGNGNIATFNNGTVSASVFVGGSAITFGDTAGNNQAYILPGSNAYTLYTAGSERLRIDSSGRVGIGTASPQFNLDVSGSGTQTIRSITTDTSGTAIGRFRAFYVGGGGGTQSAVDLRAGDNYAYLLAESNVPLLFGTNNTERARIDSSGRLLVGTSTSRNGGYADPAQVLIEGLNYNTAAQSIILNSNDGNGASLNFAKSRGTTLNSFTIVQSGDRIGLIDFAGADGSTLRRAAVIEAFVDGTPGSADMPGRLVFSTTADGASSPTERMRITNGGNVLIGTTSTTPNPGIVFSPGFNAQITIGHDNTSGSGQYYIPFYYNGGLIGGVTQNGTTAVAYNTTSDYRLKENVTAVTDGIVRLQQLKPCKFNFIAEPDRTVDGFIAHEVQEVIPEAITGVKDAEDEDGNPIYQGIDQSKLVPLLTAALQEAVARIEQLEIAVATLQGS